MRYYLLFLIAALTATFSAKAQLDAQLEVVNDSKSINDARARVEVQGGTPPYEYKWSIQSVPLTQSSVSKQTEGLPISVVVTDATGESVELQGSTPAESTEEKLNTFLTPTVNAIGSVLFWDPFAAMGIYDPVMRDEAGDPILHPNGDPRKNAIPFIVFWLVAGAIFFTFRMGFINVRGIKQAYNLVRGKYDNPDDKGEVSHFQALTTALSATVGLGNIAGVAIAISLGGPGATFWMILAGLLGMASKFTECTLGVKYRHIDENGEVSGGPMYYLSEGLAKKKMAGLGKILAGLFAILCVGASFGGGNMFQANQAFAQVVNKIALFEGNGFWFGVLLAILVGLVIIGGIKSIARVTDKIVPVMVAVYVGAAIIIIMRNITNIDNAFNSIINGAFSPDAMLGGFLGVLVIGFQRAAFSNEAGVGSASIAHSASRTNYPISEGIVALLEPFIDTVVVCTMTALVLIFTGYAESPGNLDGSEITTAAFSSVFGWFDWVLLAAIVLFAFSTMISWSYYGLKAWTYLLGEGRTQKNIYKLLFLGFIILGSSAGLGAVLDFSDMMILGMAFPNILGLIILSGEVRKDLKEYFEKIKSGVIKRFKK